MVEQAVSALCSWPMVAAVVVALLRSHREAAEADRLGLDRLDRVQLIALGDRPLRPLEQRVSPGRVLVG